MQIFPSAAQTSTYFLYRKQMDSKIFKMLYSKWHLTQRAELAVLKPDFWNMLNAHSSAGSQGELQSSAHVGNRAMLLRVLC